VLRASGVTDKGCVRRRNEDRFAIDESLQLLVVADGLGGHNAGEVAARIAVDNLVEFVRSRRSPTGPAPGPEWPFGFDPALTAVGNAVRTGICLANAEILEMSMTCDDYFGMGTTLVVALVEGNRVAVGHVGDSRVYLLASGGLRALTTDDSWLATMLAENPKINPDAVRDHPLRNALTNVVGGGARTQVHVIEETLSEGDLLLLSTDGVHGVLDADLLQRLMSGTDDLGKMASKLVSEAMSHGSRDNCTAVVARYA
jgi:protein phosphatase